MGKDDIVSSSKSLNQPGAHGFSDANARSIQQRLDRLRLYRHDIWERLLRAKRDGEAGLTYGRWMEIIDTGDSLMQSGQMTIDEDCWIPREPKQLTRFVQELTKFGEWTSLEEEEAPLLGAGEYNYSAIIPSYELPRDSEPDHLASGPRPAQPQQQNKQQPRLHRSRSIVDVTLSSRPEMRQPIGTLPISRYRLNLLPDDTDAPGRRNSKSTESPKRPTRSIHDAYRWLMNSDTSILPAMENNIESSKPTADRSRSIREAYRYVFASEVEEDEAEEDAEEDPLQELAANAIDWRGFPPTLTEDQVSTRQVEQTKLAEEAQRALSQATLSTSSKRLNEAFQVLQASFDRWVIDEDLPGLRPSSGSASGHVANTPTSTANPSRVLGRTRSATRSKILAGPSKLSSQGPDGLFDQQIHSWWWLIVQGMDG